MSRPRLNPLWSGLVTAIALAVLMTGVVALGIPAGPQLPLPWNHSTTLHVQLADADALAPHASVEVAGVKIGEVQSVAAQGTIAVATLQIAPRYSDIHRDATVYLRAHGLFGPKYIAIVPGTSAAAVLHDGDTIPITQAVQPVDLAAILQALQAPEQQNLRTTIVEFGQAAAGRGDDFNHLLAAANSLSKVLDSPLKAVDTVAPQLSDMLVQNESFNSYFAQTPLDQLVANSAQTFQAFAANSSQLQSLLVHADSSLTQLDTALNGQPGHLTSIIQQLGTPGGTVDRLNKFTYLLALFGANLTGKEAGLGTDPAAKDVTAGIIGAITNIASAFYYDNACPPTTAPPGSTNDNHCSVSPDGRAHYLQARLGNFPPNGQPNPTYSTSYQSVLGPLQSAGSQLSSFGSLLAS
jgi:virulence factor Mce-like protein